MSNHIKLQELLKNRERISEEERRKHHSASSSKGTGKRITEEDKKVYKKLFDEFVELETEDDVWKLPRYDDDGNDNKDLLKATISKHNESILRNIKKNDTALIMYYYITKNTIHLAKIDLQRGIELEVVERYKENKVAMTRKKLDTEEYLNG